MRDTQANRELIGQVCRRERQFQIEFLGQPRPAVHFLRRQIVGNVQQQRAGLQQGLGLNSLGQRGQRHILRIDAQHDAVGDALLKRFQHGRAGAHRIDIDIGPLELLDQLRPTNCIGLQQHHVPRWLIEELANIDQEPLERFRRGDRLGQHAPRTELQSALGLIDGRNDVHRNMPQRKIVFQALEHAPAIDIGQ